ncbi:hypothetical protein [Nonomuraea sp. JJY05]|uniref:hypothetical protein n=1 Tax=Nonomuraea sp. JJY05 TaxID=3350255 RepID=UPI00373F63AA
MRPCSTGSTSGSGRRWSGRWTRTRPAAVLGAAVTLAVERPWESPGNDAGTPAARSTMSVQIDFLTRQGGSVRLRWTVIVTRRMGPVTSAIV